MRGHRRYYKRDDYCCRYHRRVDFIGLLAVVVFAIYAMPLYGVYLLIAGKHEGQKFLGGILTVVGFVFWIALGIH